MNPVQKKKVMNIKNMLVLLGDIYKKMKPTKLRTEYQRLLYFIQSDKADFKKILEKIGENITVYESAANKIEGLENESVVKFWKQIRTIIMTTYSENRKLDRSI